MVKLLMPSVASVIRITSWAVKYTPSFLPLAYPFVFISRYVHQLFVLLLIVPIVFFITLWISLHFISCTMGVIGAICQGADDCSADGQFLLKLTALHHIVC